MEKARFFFLLRLARHLKKLGDNKDERGIPLIWASLGFENGWSANK